MFLPFRQHDMKILQQIITSITAISNISEPAIVFASVSFCKKYVRSPKCDFWKAAAEVGVKKVDLFHREHIAPGF